MKRVVILAITVNLLSAGRSHGIVTVDDFSTTQIVTSSPGYVSGPGIIGVERDTEANSPTVNINSAVPGQFLAYNADPTNWGTIFLTYDGVDQNTSFSFLDGLGNVDLTQGGTNDRFRIPVTAATNLGGSLTLTLRNIGFVGSSITVPLPTTPGVMELRFADFQLAPFAASQPVNFADVGHIELQLGLFPGESYTFDSIVAVPEPTSMALIVSAAIATAVLRGAKSRLPITHSTSTPRRPLRELFAAGPTWAGSV